MRRSRVEGAFRAQGARLGLPDATLAAVLSAHRDAARQSPGGESDDGQHSLASDDRASAGSPGGASNNTSGSDISVSLRSTLFEDDREDAALGAGSSGGDPLGSPGANPAHGAERQTNARLLEQLEAVRHEKQLLEIDYERVERLARRQLADSARRYKARIRELEDKLSAATVDVPKLRDRLDARRADFANLECSAATYEQLRNVSEDQLSTRELVLVRVFELCAKQREQLATSNDEVRKAQVHASECAARAEDAEAALGRTQEKFQERIRALEAELSEARQAARHNHSKYLEAIEHGNQVHEKASLSARHQARAEDLERDKAAALRQADNALEQARLAEANLAIKDGELRALQEQSELLRVDKSYLERERDEGRQSALRAEQALERERDRSRELEGRLETLRDQLLEAQSSSKSEYEDRLQREVSTIKSTNERQLAELKEVQLNTTEREVRSLRLAREEAISELEHVRSQLDSARKELEDARLELATREATHRSTMAELRSQLNMRIFETSSLASTIEEKAAAARKLELQNEMLENKLEVLRTDFGALETSTSKHIVELNAKVASQEEKLNMYEALELEVDGALLDQARYRVEQAESRGPRPQSDQAAVEGLIRVVREGGAGVDGSTTSLMPVAAQRRVKHSVMLAERLIKAERLLEASRADCRERDGALAIMRKSLEAAQQAAAAVSQPQAYLVAKIQEKEGLLARAAERAEALEASLAEALESRRQLHTDFEAVLQDRAALERAVRDQAEAQRQGVVLGMASATPLPVTPVEGGSPRSAPLSSGGGRSSPTVAQLHALQSRAAAAEYSEEAGPFEGVVQEVDDPDTSRVLNSSTGSVGTAASLETSAAFVLHREDDDGLPLPKWYRKLRQPS